MRTSRVTLQVRWKRAAERAEHEGIRIAQVAGTGQWVALSSSTSGTAYGIAVTGNVAHDCDCLAGLNGDPVCKHRAAFYILIGALALPEPEPPAPATYAPCEVCNGSGSHYDRTLDQLGWFYPTCRSCHGSGQVAAHAA